MADGFGLLVDSTLGGIAMGLVALSSAEICAQNIELEQKSGTAKLSDHLAACLRSQNASVKDIRYVLASNGPGSFTGIKVGLAFALGLQKAAAPEVRFWTASSLKLFAEHFLKDQTSSAVLLPATRTRAAAVRVRAGMPAEVFDFNIESKEQLSSVKLENMYFLAPSPMLEFMLNHGSVKRVEQVKLDDVMPLVMQLLSKELMRRAEAKDASDQLEPFYLRLSSAEEKIAAR